MSSPSHLATPNVPLSRAWNTWTADRYVEMSFLPLGLRLTPLVYAASVGRVSRGPARNHCGYSSHCARDPSVICAVAARSSAATRSRDRIA